MLLNHTSGIAEFQDSMSDSDLALSWTPEELIDLAVQAEPFAPPGGSVATTPQM